MTRSLALSPGWSRGRKSQMIFHTINIPPQRPCETRHQKSDSHHVFIRRLHLMPRRPSEKLPRFGPSARITGHLPYLGLQSAVQEDFPSSGWANFA